MYLRTFKPDYFYSKTFLKFTPMYFILYSWILQKKAFSEACNSRIDLRGVKQWYFTSCHKTDGGKKEHKEGGRGGEARQEEAEEDVI